MLNRATLKATCRSRRLLEQYRDQPAGRESQQEQSRQQEQQHRFSLCPVCVLA